MAVNGHGGECCGINHSHSYYGTLDQNKKQLDSDRRRIRRGVLCEVVLTDHQVSDGFAGHLFKEGFRLVSRFVNGNSANYVNVFHYHIDPLLTSLETLPFPVETTKEPIFGPLPDGYVPASGEDVRIRGREGVPCEYEGKGDRSTKTTLVYIRGYGGRRRVPWDSILVKIGEK